MSATIASSSPLDDHYSLALSLAYRAGLLISSSLSVTKHITIKSNILDIVTETDKECERLIINGVKNANPEHRFIAEESHSTPGEYHFTDHPTWIIDPVDGTNNFVHGLPFVCVSIAVMINRQVMIGIVHNPIMMETFTARQGQGAHLITHTRRVDQQEGDAFPDTDSFSKLYVSSTPVSISPSRLSSLSLSAVITELGYDRSVSGISAQLERLRVLTTVHSLQSLRSYGSCALNMCYVAAGRCEAYYEGRDKHVGPKPWDMAAAMLIVREAGGLVLDTRGGEVDICSGRVLAVNQRALADILLAVFRQVEEVQQPQQQQHSQVDQRDK